MSEEEKFFPEKENVQSESEGSGGKFSNLEDAIESARAHMESAMQIEGRLQDSNVIDVYKSPDGSFWATNGHWVREAETETAERLGLEPSQELPENEKYELVWSDSKG